MIALARTCQILKCLQYITTVRCELDRVLSRVRPDDVKITRCLEECANVNLSGGAETACFKSDIWPSVFFHNDPQTA